VANRVHVFVSHDKSHCESELMDGVLQDIHHIMRISGSVSE
jgi:hypothetical protein